MINWFIPVQTGLVGQYLFVGGCLIACMQCRGGSSDDVRLSGDNAYNMMYMKMHFASEGIGYISACSMVERMCSICLDLEVYLNCCDSLCVKGNNQSWWSK